MVEKNCKTVIAVFLVLFCKTVLSDKTRACQRNIMALQEMEIMPSDIIPQKTLNDIDSMYYYLKQKLNTAKQITDLIPFIKKLMNIKELKQHLDTALDKEYKSAEPKSDINIRSLFVSLFSLNGIPSDNIHAHILSFLPSTEYKKLSLLSRHFKFICRNNPYLYNNMGYTVQLTFSLDRKCLSKDSKTGIKVYHTGSSWNPVGVYFTAMDKKKPSKLSSKDVNNLIIPIKQIKRWKLREEYVWRDLIQRHGILKDNEWQDGHNQYLCDDLLKTHINNIEKLQIQLKHKDIIESVFGESNQYNQCTVLSIMDSKDIVFTKSTFQNLQCLELITDDEYSFGTEMSIENVKIIIEATPPSLKCFQYKSSKSRRYRRLEMINTTETLRIPAQIEWCSIMTSASQTLSVDISDCDKLIGVQLIGVNEEKIIWPNDGAYMIPFVCISTGKEKIRDKNLNVKGVCLLKKQRIVDDDDSGYPWRDSRYKWVYDDDEKMNKVNAIKVFDVEESKKSEEEKCMVLDRNGCDEILFYRILQYAVKDENKRNKVLKMCKRWWYLGSADWLKNIGYVKKS